MSKATIKEVAAEAAVSTATVSRVLSGSGFVSDTVKTRVHAAVKKLNYRPSAIARSLKQDKTYMIGVIVPDISNPYFMGISRGIEDVIGQDGFQLMFCSSDENPDKERALLKLLYEKRVDALVLATAGDTKAAVSELAKGGMPVVLVDRSLEVEEDPLEVDLIAEDNVHGAYLLTKRLLAEGHRRIGIINGRASVSTGRERYTGVLRALEEAGLASASSAILYNGDFTVEGGIRGTRQFLQLPERPTAILSLNNRMTFGVLLELIRSKYHIPEDMAVASFGEVEAGQLLKQPNLHYIDQSPYEMGRRAGETLLQRLRGKGSVASEPVVEIFRNELKTLD